MREKMDRALRAKQFLPFSAVKGLEEALERKRIEKGKAQKRVILDDAANELDLEISILTSRDKIIIEFYDDGEYKSGKYVFKKIDKEKGIIFTEEEELFLSDIYSIKRIDE